MSRGSALLEVLAVGFVAALLVLQTLVTVTRLQVAGEEAAEAAQAGALHGARHGDPVTAQQLVTRLSPRAHATSVRLDPGHAYAEARVRVPLVGPPGTPLTKTVRAEATVRVSPYRSARPG